MLDVRLVNDMFIFFEDNKPKTYTEIAHLNEAQRYSLAANWTDHGNVTELAKLVKSFGGKPVRTVYIRNGFISFMKNGCYVAHIDDPMTVEERINVVNDWEQNGKLPNWATVSND